MFTWHIRSGKMEREGAAVAVGYSGRGRGLNNPDLCTLKGVEGCTDAGPIVPGDYRITGVQETHGGFALVLTPSLANEMHGRGSFLIHGDLKDQSKPHQASLGCIILPRAVRESIWASRDRDLQVVKE